MATIFYSMAGEGRGHAARVRAVTEVLRADHRIHLYAPEQAYDFLEPIYRGSEVRVTRIPGLVFQYSRGTGQDNGREQVAYFRTLLHTGKYLATRWRWAKPVVADFIAYRPALVISDFEPELPRLANRFGVPWISLDHQNFLRTYDLSPLPPKLRSHLWYMRAVVAAYGNGACHRVVSSFYFPPLRSGLEKVTQVGLMFRAELHQAQPADAGHITAYLRRGLSSNVRQALAECGRPVHIFTSMPEPMQGNLQFYKVNPDTFTHSLSQCAALVTTAGNQLVGEALFLGKPVLAMPEPGNIEQEINGYFLNACGGGISMPMPRLSSTVLRNFLANSGQYRLDETYRQRLDGLPETTRVLRNLLATLV